MLKKMVAKGVEKSGDLLIREETRLATARKNMLVDG